MFTNWGHVLFVCVSKRFSLYHNNNSVENLYGSRNFFNAPRIRVTMRPPHRTNVTCKRFIEKAKQSRTKYIKEYLTRPAGRREVPVNQRHTKDIHKSHSSFPTIVYNIIRIPRRNRIYFYRKRKNKRERIVVMYNNIYEPHHTHIVNRN